ncbi:MAG: ABC transporter substrate-binding protein [Planctomycetota bacterium]
MRIERWGWVLAVAGWCFVAGGGCGGSGEPRYADSEMRIVSLAPAITQVVEELGLRRAVVAVGAGDDIARPAAEDLGSFVDPDLERMSALAPTHLLAMTGRAGLPRRMVELAERRRIVLADLEYPADLGAALGLIVEVGEALGRGDRARALSDRVRSELAGIERLTAGRPRPRVLLVFAADPVMASGPGTVNDEVLRIAGGENAAAGASVTAPVYDREALRALSPEVIVLMQPGRPPLSGMDDPRLDGFRGLALPAMQAERVYLLNDPAVLHPGPSVSITAASLAVALHPDLAERVAEVFRGAP